MLKTDDAKIFQAKGEDFTCVTFYPDLSKFKMEKLDKDIVDLFTRRAYDLVASTRGVKVILNGVRLPVSTLFSEIMSSMRFSFINLCHICWTSGKGKFLKTCSNCSQFIVYLTLSYGQATEWTMKTL